MNVLPQTIDLNPKSNAPQASVIWLHGLGADANDFVPMVEQLEIANRYNVRFVFPYAPIRPITVNNGMKMRGWYDIAGLDFSTKEDIEGIAASANMMGYLIEREIELTIPSTNIILGGFSQGGAIALYTGLRYPKPLGGIIALSTYLPALTTLNDERNSLNNTIPIFMAHGLFDPIVPLMLGEMSRQHLLTLGYPLEWHSYPMPHTVLPEEIVDIDRFLKTILKK